MSTTDYDLLLELEDILKKHINTYEYPVFAFNDDQDLFDSQLCPCINIVPGTKERSEGRIGGSTPYNTNPSFIIQCWESSLEGYKEAYQAVVVLEENVFSAINGNKTLNGKVKKTSIGTTEYDYEKYTSTFYIIAEIQLTFDIDR